MFKTITDKLKNIYKVVSFTNTRLYVIPINVATTIVNKVEYTQLNKIELTKEKEYCLKIKVNRIGKVQSNFEMSKENTNGVHEPTFPYSNITSISNMEQANLPWYFYYSKINDKFDLDEFQKINCLKNKEY